MSTSLNVDVVIFGGGAAGLWLLDVLRRQSKHVLLLEAHDLGSGQTIASQGIIHGGLKYTLTGLFTPAARAIKEMPVLWRRCLAGEIEPDLSACRLRAQFCYLWRTDSISSRLAMIGARAGLRIKPNVVPNDERPDVLAHVPGAVARLDEQVIEPGSFLEVLFARNRGSILKVDVESGVEMHMEDGSLSVVRLINPETGEPLDIKPKHVALLAGRGNGQLRNAFRLPEESMQRRPLHMVMARGDVRQLPALNGHCVDGAATRLTITSTIGLDERRIWQIGGHIAEAGVSLDRDALLDFARKEVREIIPGISLRGVEWSTYVVDRAEAASGGARPEDARVLHEGNIITGWPTKLALVPKLVEMILAKIDVKSETSGKQELKQPSVIATWPRPAVALPPWEIEQEWLSDL